MAMRNSSLFRPRVAATQCFIIAALCLVTSIPGGCGDYGTKDETNNPSYGNFSSVLGMWKTKVPLWLKSTSGNLYLEATDQQYTDRTRIIAVLPAGTEIRIEHLIVEKTVEVDFVYATGSFTSGPFAGKTFRLDDRLFVPNYFHLQDVDATTQPAVMQKRWAVAPDKLER